MRSRSMVALCSLVALAAGAGGLSAEGGPDSRPGLAVFPIWNSGSYGQDKENFDALQRGMAAMIISELAANPGARVVEREELQRLLEEQKLGAAGRVDDATAARIGKRSEEHTSELQSRQYLVCRLLLEKKKKKNQNHKQTKKLQT